MATTVCTSTDELQYLGTEELPIQWPGRVKEYLNSKPNRIGYGENDVFPVLCIEKGRCFLAP